jgi:hypothetical protein
LPSHLTDGRIERPTGNGPACRCRCRSARLPVARRSKYTVVRGAIGLCLFIPASPPRTCLRLPLAWGPCARAVASIERLWPCSARLISEKQSRASQFACEIGRVVSGRVWMVDCSATALRQIARAGAARSPPMRASHSYIETSGLESSSRPSTEAAGKGSLDYRALMALSVV